MSIKWRPILNFHCTFPLSSFINCLGPFLRHIWRKIARLSNIRLRECFESLLRVRIRCLKESRKTHLFSQDFDSLIFWLYLYHLFFFSPCTWIVLLTSSSHKFICLYFICFNSSVYTHYLSNSLKHSVYFLCTVRVTTINGIL